MRREVRKPLRGTQPGQDRAHVNLQSPGSQDPAEFSFYHSRGWQTFSLTGPIVYILSFARHMVSALLLSEKEAQCVKEWVWPCFRKTFLSEHVVGWIWCTGVRESSPDLLQSCLFPSHPFVTTASQSPWRVPSSLANWPIRKTPAGFSSSPVHLSWLQDGHFHSCLPSRPIGR